MALRNAGGLHAMRSRYCCVRRDDMFEDQKRAAGTVTRSSTQITWPMCWAVLSHPLLWGTALRQMHFLAPSGWWRRAPFLPLPDPAYMRFRIVTAYGGDGSAEPKPSDLITYLRWCRSWPAATSK
jgi:hypothetical protein